VLTQVRYGIAELSLPMHKGWWILHWQSLVYSMNHSRKSVNP
jgi:hypothetical protein